MRSGGGGVGARNRVSLPNLGYAAKIVAETRFLVREIRYSIAMGIQPSLAPTKFRMYLTRVKTAIMSDIFITIRNQNDNAMTSVDGMAFVAILKQDGSIVDRKLVGLRFADAQFPNMPPGQYTAIAFHESVNPPSASQEVTLLASELLDVRFQYLEPERQLLRVIVQHIPFDMTDL